VNRQSCDGQSHAQTESSNYRYVLTHDSDSPPSSRRTYTSTCGANEQEECPVTLFRMEAASNGKSTKIWASFRRIADVLKRGFRLRTPTKVQGHEQIKLIFIY